MAIAKSETLDVQGTSIRSDISWVFRLRRSGVRNTSLLPIYVLSMIPVLGRKLNTIHSYGHVRLKAHLFSCIVYKVER